MLWIFPAFARNPTRSGSWSRVTRFSILHFSIGFPNFFKLSPEMIYLGQGWPTRVSRAACGLEKIFCGPILDWNSVIFRYFEWFSTVFVKNWPKKSIFLEIFPNAAQRPIWVGHPWIKFLRFNLNIFPEIRKFHNKHGVPNFIMRGVRQVPPPK